MAAPSLPATAQSLIGRDREIAQLTSLLRDPSIRLITLTGPGGVGKTQLSAEAVRGLIATGEKDVTFVALAALSDPDLVAPTIGQAFGLSNVDAGALPERLGVVVGDRPALLLLDNFEHLVGAAPLIVALLNASHVLQVLVTSRVLLRLSLEREFPVQPLPYLTSGIAPIAERAPAVELFLHRADLDGERLSADELTTIAEICRRADGLPLAIELAAAKSRLLSLPELLDRMDPALPLLVDGHRDAPVRLQTMYNAVAWSYELLIPEEKRLFSALSVFSGGFTILAAEAIGGAFGVANVLAALQTLLDHSLIQRVRSEDRSQRFAMLETIREYGLARLAASGDEHSVRAAHAAWFSGSFPSQPIRNVIGLTWHDFLLPGDQDNLRSALRWSLAQGDGVASTAIAIQLTPFWWRQGYFSEARDAYLALVDIADSLPLALRSTVFGAAAEFALQLSAFASSGELATQALGYARELNDDERIRWHLRQVSWATMVFDPAAAVASAEEIVEISEQAGDLKGTVRSLCMLSMCKVYDNRLEEAIAHELDAEAVMKGLTEPDFALETEQIQMRGSLDFYSARYDEALPLLTKALAGRRAQGNRVFEMHGLRDIGRIHLATGDRTQAAERFAEALEIAYLLGSEHGKSYCFDEAAAAGSIDEDSAQLLGASSAIRERLRLASIPTEKALRASTRSRLTASMGDSRFEDHFRSGTRLSGLEAYRVARRSLDSALSASEPRPDSLLTGRELEVLRLIAEGKSDREIGEILFISRRTAATHVSSILRKNDLQSRAEAAAWAVRNDLC